MLTLNIHDLALVFIGQILAFSACLILLGLRDTMARLWLLSNVADIAGLLLFATTGEDAYRFWAYGGSLAISSFVLKAFVLAGGRWGGRYHRAMIVLMAISLVSAVIMSVVINTPYRMLLGVIGMGCATGATLLGILGNRRWLGLRPTGPLAFTLATAIIVLFALVGRAYPFAPQTIVFEPSATGVSNFLLMGMFSMLMQFIYLALIFARDNRTRQAIVNRETRLFSAAKINRAVLIETRALADERQNLIKMLTHEVRQPLNTAQAALQSIATDVTALKIQDVAVKAKLDNTLTVLNAITLSISNSLLGATLISKRKKPRLETINISDVAQLAYLDIDIAEQHRINFQFTEPYLYTDADPMVLRLALRNLLENAVKYSPAGTPIVFKIEANEDRLAVQFAVTNGIIDKAMLAGDIFARHKRGVDSSYNGDGLGLFIVKEVTEMHEGTLRYDIVGNEVTFVMEIPA